MKYILFFIAILVIIVLIGGAVSPPTPKTAFQRCEAQANPNDSVGTRLQAAVSHLRSDSDTATMMRLCDGLPYEAGDGR